MHVPSANCSGTGLDICSSDYSPDLQRSLELLVCMQVRHGMSLAHFLVALLTAAFAAGAMI